MANIDRLNKHDYSAFSGIVMGKLYRKDGEWKFQAVGEGRNGDINTFASSFR
jgi:tellurium resistance protein TerD